MPQNADWTEVGSAVAGLATATRAGETNARHSITMVSASYSVAQVGLLQVKLDGAVEYERYVHNACDIDLSSALRGLSGKAVSAELAAGAGGVTGKVCLFGVTS